MVDRNVFLEELAELIEMEDDSNILTEDTDTEDIVFDSITKLGVLALIDTYSSKKVKVQDLLDCKKIKDIIELVY